MVGILCHILIVYLWDIRTRYFHYRALKPEEFSRSTPRCVYLPGILTCTCAKCSNSRCELSHTEPLQLVWIIETPWKIHHFLPFVLHGTCESANLVWSAAVSISQFAGRVCRQRLDSITLRRRLDSCRTPPVRLLSTQHCISLPSQHVTAIITGD